MNNNEFLNIFRKYYLLNEGNKTVQDTIIKMCSEIIGRPEDKVFEIMFEGDYDD